MNYFRFTIPGQPPSWNASYRMRKAKVQDRYGQPVLGPDGSPKTASRLYKTQEVLDYQDTITWLVRTARPPNFFPKGDLIIGYQFYLARSMDCDNVMKAVNDAIAKALGVNDSRFLPVTVSRAVLPKNPHVAITVFDAQFWQTTISPLAA